MAAVVAARSLTEAFSLRASATSLLLANSPDLTCANLMCAKVGRGCACRLALSLGRMPALRIVDVSGCGLDALPDDLWALPALEEVRAAGNALAALPDAVGACAALRVLDVRDNRIVALPWAALAALPMLRVLRVSGNPGAAVGGAASWCARLADRGVEVVC